MAPYSLLPRDDTASATDAAAASDTATATATDSASASDASATASSASTGSSSSSSWLTTHKTDVYIAIAVVLGVLLLLMLVIWKKNRLSFWPFRQKRCSGPDSCGKGISKSFKLDKDYFANGSGGWRCRDCQERKEDEAIEKEMQDDHYDDEDTLEDELDLKEAGRKKRRHVEEEGEEGDREVGKKGSGGVRGKKDGDRSREGGGSEKEGRGGIEAKRAVGQEIEKGRNVPARRQREGDGAAPKKTAARKRRDDSDDEYSD